MCGSGRKHDQGWKERPIFGKVRYMNESGLKRKFNMEAYVTKVQTLVKKMGGRLALPLQSAMDQFIKTTPALESAKTKKKVVREMTNETTVSPAKKKQKQLKLK